MNIDSLKQSIAPYRGIIRFMLVLIVANFVWKLTIVGDEGSNAVTFFGCDISVPFIWMSAHIASAVQWLLHSIGYSVSLADDTLVSFGNGQRVRIIWACTGIKQTFIFCCILLCSRGAWRHKLWFVPMGIVACYAINILRIALLSMAVCDCPEWFPVLHDYVSKYAFYAIIFLMWVWWEECFNKPVGTQNKNDELSSTENSSFV